MKLTPKQKLTIFSISSCMANTTKQEIEVASVLPEPVARLSYQNGPIEGYRFGTHKPRGKRKEFHLDIKTGDLVFEGWDLPIVTDFEIVREGGSRTFSGNACYNLALREPMSERRLDAIFIRAFIGEKALLPAPQETLGAVVLVRPEDGYDDGTPVYPEINVAHAVINRMKEKQPVAA